MIRGKKLSRRAFFARSAALVAAGGLAACSHDNSGYSLYRSATTMGERQDLINAAKKEGTLTVYLAMAQEPFTDWAKGFTNTYGISVLAQMQGNNALFSRWAQETRAGKNIADFVIFGGQDLLGEARKNGWVARYTPCERFEICTRSFKRLRQLVRPVPCDRASHLQFGPSHEGRSRQSLIEYIRSSV